MANLLRSAAAGSSIRPWASNERAKIGAPWLSAKSDQSEFFISSPLGLVVAAENAAENAVEIARAVAVDFFYH